jgi:hypothetical protein
LWSQQNKVEHQIPLFVIHFRMNQQQHQVYGGAAAAAAAPALPLPPALTGTHLIVF